ncbi:hypothetical protein L7F22_021128 [Adiantum nelumboides]|nr:hypothetical protein [Adiantum nelumboides]
MNLQFVPDVGAACLVLHNICICHGEVFDMEWVREAEAKLACMGQTGEGQRCAITSMIELQATRTVGSEEAMERAQGGNDGACDLGSSSERRDNLARAMYREQARVNIHQVFGEQALADMDSLSSSTYHCICSTIFIGTTCSPSVETRPSDPTLPLATGRGGHAGVYVRAATSSKDDSVPEASEQIQQLFDANSANTAVIPTVFGAAFHPSYCSASIRPSSLGLPAFFPSRRALCICPHTSNSSFSARRVKYDAMENKSQVWIYGGGALVALWFSFIVIGAVNNIPLLPKLPEFVGPCYIGLFVYWYPLFKSSRKQLATNIEELKLKVTGVPRNAFMTEDNV